jgi:hypothetical protein
VVWEFLWIGSISQQNIFPFALVFTLPRLISAVPMRADLLGNNQRRSEPADCAQQTAGFFI